MTTGPRIRSRAFYGAVLALPVVVQAGLLATGRLRAFWTAFSLDSPMSPEVFWNGMVTSILGSLGIAPLLFAAWELGRQHTAARRLNYELLVGLRDVVRLALGKQPSARELEARDRPPKDNPRQALLLGAGVGALVPAFFMGVLAPLRTGPAAVWLTGAGVIMGSLAYCARRAGLPSRRAGPPGPDPALPAAQPVAIRAGGPALRTVAGRGDAAADGLVACGRRARHATPVNSLTSHRRPHRGAATRRPTSRG